MSDALPAIWSAVAASFAALSSFLLMRIHRLNRLESARPELILTEWTRTTRGQSDSEHDVISFQAIRNAGRGPALHIHLNAEESRGKFLIAVMSSLRLAILAPGDREQIDGEIIVWWKNVKPVDAGHRFASITIDIMCWDTVGRRHETSYRLLVAEERTSMIMSDAIAPNVYLTSRTTKATPVWRLKLSTRLARTPGLRRLCRKRDRHAEGDRKSSGQPDQADGSDTADGGSAE